MVAGAAFAETSLSTWNRYIATPAAVDINNGNTSTITDLDCGWNGNAYWQVAASFGNDVAGVFVKNSLYGNPAAAGVWAKPFDFIKVQLDTGWSEGTGSMGLGYGMYGWLRSNAAGDGDNFFFNESTGNMAVVLTPISGLWLKADLTLGDDIADAYAKSTYAAGYTMDGIGSVAVQYNGSTSDNGKINAAVSLTAVPNLFAAIGAYIPLDKPETTSLRIGGNYNVSIATIHVIGRVDLGNTIVANVGAGCDLQINDDYAVLLDCRYLTTDNAVAGMVAAQKSLGNGTIGAGVEVSTTGFSDFGTGTTIAFPVKVELAF